MPSPMTPKPDWAAVVMRLERYYRHLDIAAECERSERWVGQLKSGHVKEPGHFAGEVLLHMDRELAELLATQPPGIPVSIRWQSRRYGTVASTATSAQKNL